MIIFNRKMLFKPKRPVPILNFRGKNITDIAQFNDRNVSINWTGNKTLVKDGVNTVPGSSGKFTYDFTNWDEFAMCYTFELLSRNTWRAILNIGYTSSKTTYGLKMEHNNSDKMHFEGISSDQNALIVINSTAPPTFPVKLNTKYNVIVNVSRTNPVGIYLNGQQIYSLTQPDNKKGFNRNNHRNCNSNAFNERLSNYEKHINSIQHSLRIWNRALTPEEIKAESKADATDYGVVLMHKRAVINKFKANEMKVGD